MLTEKETQNLKAFMSLDVQSGSYEFLSLVFLKSIELIVASFTLIKEDCDKLLSEKAKHE